MLGLALVASGQEAEHEVKAQFIERFTRFVEWPATSAAADDTTPFVIGVLGDEPLRASLADLGGRTQIKGKRVEVVALSEPSGAIDCQAVFISAARKAEVAKLVEVTQSRPILTVGDGADFARQGVLVNFYHEGKHLRFEINDAAARKAGLRVAADLLAVARVVD